MLIFHQHCFFSYCWSIHWNVNFFTTIVSLAVAGLYVEMLIFHQHYFCSCCMSIHWNVNFSPALFLYLLLVYTLKCSFFTSIVSLSVAGLYNDMLIFTSIVSVAVAGLYNDMLIFHQHCFFSYCWSIHLNVNFSPAMFL